MSRTRRYYILGAVAAFLLAASVFVFTVGPERIVEIVGVENTYVVAFLLATIGGLSTITSSSYFAAIATFSAGGANPIALGFLGGLGIFISDTIFYHLALLGKRFVPESWAKRIRAFAQWSRRFPTWAVLIFVYVYIAFIPLANDPLLLALVAAGFRYRLVAPVILAGSVSIALLTAYLGRTGFLFF